eukprot:1187822-Prorocentrum_minimum.AAC.6
MISSGALKLLRICSEGPEQLTILSTAARTDGVLSKSTQHPCPPDKKMISYAQTSTVSNGMDSLNFFMASSFASKVLQSSV